MSTPAPATTVSPRRSPSNSRPRSPGRGGPVQVDAAASEVAPQVSRPPLTEGLGRLYQAISAAGKTPDPAALDNVKSLLHAESANLRVIAPDGVTPIHHTVTVNSIPILELCLAIDPTLANVCDSDDATPLHYAAESGFNAMVKALIRAGANVDARDHNLMTPLHYAAKEGFDDVVETLLDEGKANIGLVDIDDMGALHHAARENQDAVVDLLMERGVSPAVVDHNDMTPLHHAADAGAVEAMSVLLDYEETPLNAGDIEGMTALHFAAREGYDRCLKMLLEADATVDIGDADGMTPLHTAALENHVAIARMLIQNGADVNAEDDNACTPLHLAAAEGNADVAALLIASNAALEARNDENETPLHIALLEKNDAVVRLLLESGADCFSALNGDTPLKLAEGNALLVALVENAIRERNSRSLWTRMTSFFGFGARRAAAHRYADPSAAEELQTMN